MKRLIILVFSWVLIHISFHSTAQEATASTTRAKESKKKHHKPKKEANAVQDKSTLAITSFNLDVIKKHIEETNKIFSTALVNGDSASIAHLFHSQTVIYPANMPSMNSGSEMGSVSILIPAMGIKSMEIKSADIFGNADMVIETGTYVLSDGKKQVDSGRYLVVWKEEDGRWKIYRDIWNSDGMMGKE